jgi:hypothetical protein
LKTSKKSSGLKAKRNGDYFENIISFFAIRQGLEVIKIPSSCKNMGIRLIAIKSPFDFILIGNFKTIFCDAKSTTKETFCYSQIDQSQIRYLSMTINNINHAGYIINFNGEVGFAPVGLLKSIKPKGSIKFRDCLDLGTLKEINFECLK